MHLRFKEFFRANLCSRVKINEIDAMFKENDIIINGNSDDIKRVSHVPKRMFVNINGMRHISNGNGYKLKGFIVNLKGNSVENYLYLTMFPLGMAVFPLGIAMFPLQMTMLRLRMATFPLQMTMLRLLMAMFRLLMAMNPFRMGELPLRIRMFPLDIRMIPLRLRTIGLQRTTTSLEWTDYR